MKIVFLQILHLKGYFTDKVLKYKSPAMCGGHIKFDYYYFLAGAAFAGAAGAAAPLAGAAGAAAGVIDASSCFN